MDQKGKTVLIVDDEKSLLEILKNKFSENGYITLEAINGKEGLDIALKNKPDLILLDIAMPVMDGIEMLKKLREDEWGKDARVILLTNFEYDEKAASGMQYGVSEYLVKANWKLEDVLGRVNEILSAPN